MEADHFCLRWNNYQSNMVTELDTLRSEEHLVDVTISCEGQKFRAHKVILSACSAYFRNVFKENPCDHPVVILKDVSHEDVEALLSFVYQGVVYVSEKKLASFLQTAELLQIKGLTGAASSIKENHTGSDKGGPPPLAPTWPVRSAKSSSSPTPPKRKKGTPVRIFKQNDVGDPGSDTNSNNGGDDENMEDNKQLVPITIKKECMDESREDMTVEGSLVIDEEGNSVTCQGSPGGTGGGSVSGNEFRDDGGDSNSGGSLALVIDGTDDDGEVKRGDDEAATLLERSLSGASVSRPFDLKSPFSSFPIPAPGQGIPEQLTPADGRAVRGEWRCMQPQRCPLCKKIFSNSGNLRQHVSNVHTPGQHVPCKFCSRVFKNKEYLRKHHVQTHNVPLRRHRAPNNANGSSGSSSSGIGNNSLNTNVAGSNSNSSSSSLLNSSSAASTYYLFNLVNQSLQ